MEHQIDQLFDYNFQSNKSLIMQAKELEKVPELSVKLFSHILNTHHIWNQRILGQKVDWGLWDNHSVKDWEDIHYDNQRTTFEIIRNTHDFDKRIEYESTEGRVYVNDLKDILLHIINHSTHHRGQILMDFRQNKIEPQPLDYILYKRTI